MRISDWSSDVCSSDLPAGNSAQDRAACTAVATIAPVIAPVSTPVVTAAIVTIPAIIAVAAIMAITAIIMATIMIAAIIMVVTARHGWRGGRSEEHTSELQSLMRISSAVFCLKKKKKQ